MYCESSFLFFLPCTDTSQPVTATNQILKTDVSDTRSATPTMQTKEVVQTNQAMQTSQAMQTNQANDTGSTSQATQSSRAMHTSETNQAGQAKRWETGLVRQESSMDVEMEGKEPTKDGVRRQLSVMDYDQDKV